jgi:hypothetical protein
MKLTEQQNQEIAEQKAQKFETKRVTSSELEKILYDAIPILDHGFVRVVDYMGDDSSLFNRPEFHTAKVQKKFQRMKV